MEVISSKDKEVASGLISQGYIRAASSFSTLVKQNIVINNELVFSYKEWGIMKEAIEVDSNSTIILTEIIGDISGQSYLIFTEEEKSGICQRCLQAFGINGNSHLHDEVIIKEVDNILSAAVITEFSNFLNIKIFGDVPKLVTKDEFYHGIKEDEIFLLSNAQLMFEDQEEFNPKFLWRLNSQFIDLVRAVGQKV